MFKIYKYKIVLLGEQNSERTYFLNLLKYGSNTIHNNYYPSDGVNFLKHKVSNIQQTDDEINNQNNDINFLYLYDCLSKSKKDYFIKPYLKDSPICLIIINPNNFAKLNDILISLDRHYNLYINNCNKNSTFIILILINYFVKKQINEVHFTEKDIINNISDFIKKKIF